jgi:iron complex outermembrane recepter protein
MFLKAGIRRERAAGAALPGAAAAVLGILTGGAAGQEPAEPATERIEVTGSHIKRSEAVAAENVQVILADEVKRSGQATVADYLRTVSSTFGNSINESFNNSFAPGAAMVGLRGLSQKDTLVLLDGRRITNYGLFQNLSDAFVDLNVIPLAAIERIEILKSGGSAVYGSDAVAGVINIILKKNTKERTVSGGGRLTTEGGAAERDVSVLWGIGDPLTDNYNVVLSASGFKRDQLLFSQRDLTRDQDYRSLQDGNLRWGLANQYRAAPRTALPTCGANGLPGTPTVGLSGAGCYYNTADQLPLLPGAERGNLTGNGSLKLSADWTAFADVFFSSEKTTQNFTPGALRSGSYVFDPATGGVTPVGNVLLASDPSARIVGGVPVASSLSYTFQSVGRRDQVVNSNTYRVSGGVKGDWLHWEWEGAYGHSQNSVSTTTINAINGRQLIADIAAGAADPYNFLNPLSTPSASDALRLSFGNSAVARLDTLDLKASGEVCDLPAGKLRAAVGTELRHESVDDEPSDTLSQGLVLNTGVTQVAASRNVFAGFAELDAQVLKSLDLNLAGREEHYSGGPGGKFSPQLTVRWQPLREFTLRAVASKGFRAPSLAESSRSTSLANQTVFDPLDPQGRPSETVGYITGGNPDVKPETSKNFDLGITVSPLNSVNLSVDWYSIWLYDVIAPNATSQAIIDNPAAFPPGSLVRAPDGTVAYAKALFTNQFAIRTSGIDFSGDVTFALPDASKLKFEIDAAYVPTFMVNCGLACSGPAPWQEYAGTNAWNYASPISGGGPIPHWKGSVTARWDSRDYAAQIVGRYVDGYDNGVTSFQLANTTQVRVSGYGAIDLYAQYKGLKNWSFSLSVVNLTDSQPPYDSAALNFFPTNTPYDPVTYDDLGRMVDLHVSYSF